MIATFLFFIVLCPISAHWKIPATVHNWKILETERFIIYYPDGLEETALRTSDIGETAVARYERIFSHRLKKQIPVFLYASPQDFAQTNLLPYPLDESTGGFTEFFRRRVVLPFQGDYAVLRHVLDHELVHAFQFDILEGERFGSYPLWLMEGMAEYISLGWDQSAEDYVRDAVLNDRMPSLRDLHQENVPNGYAYYKCGQAVMLFIAETYGTDRIAAFLKFWKTEGNLDRASRAAFHVSAVELDLQFGRFIRARYAKPLAAYVRSEDDRLRNATNRYQSHTGFQLLPAVSPDGKNFAYITLDGIFPAIVIRRMPGPGITEAEQSETRLVLRALRSKDYEEVQLLTTRLSYTPDGKALLVAGRREGKQTLLFFDARSGNLVESYSPPFDSMGYPALSPDGKLIVFSALASGKTDLYILSRADGSVRRITNDLYAETTPTFSADGTKVYYSSSAGRSLIETGSNIFRVDARGGTPVQITELPGANDEPASFADGSIVFRSSQNGIKNAYRIKDADQLSSPVHKATPVTGSLTGLAHLSAAGEKLVFTEYVEGAHEIRVLPVISPVFEIDEDLLTFNPGDHYPLADVNRSAKVLRNNADYSPSLYFDGVPFILITGGAGPGGKTSAAALAFAQFSYESCDHQLTSLTSYNYSPSELNLSLEYAYLKYRADFFAGAFRQTGIFAVFNFLDFSLNNLLYNPFFRLLNQNSAGAYAGVEYPLHSFGAVTAVVTTGREEKIYQSQQPQERRQNDVYRNYQSLGLGYTLNNIAYSMYGPLDGHSFSLDYSMPIQFSDRDRQLDVVTAEFKAHHLFDSFSSISFRAFAAHASGRDADDYPFQIGGYYSLRGYDFLEFQGKNAFLLNLEYRFTFIEYLQFGIPTSWSPGLIRGAAFLDAGSAFDRPQEFQAFSGRYGVTRDLHLSFGLGLHWANFLGFIFPGALMKIEWATPYDLKRALPLSKWKGNFSVGFNF